MYFLNPIEKASFEPPSPPTQTHFLRHETICRASDYFGCGPVEAGWPAGRTAFEKPVALVNDHPATPHPHAHTHRIPSYNIINEKL